MPTIKISGVVITFNEEGNIQECLKSLSQVVDELVVVDSFSTDQTREIALRSGARVLTHAFEGHIQQKNWAMQQATHDFILSLVGDEVLSDQLIKKIKEVKSSKKFDALSFHRLNFYCGRPVRFGGWYPDRRIRLWDRQKGSWNGENPHDSVHMQNSAKIENIPFDIYHYSYLSVAEHVAQSNKFSEIASLEAFKRGREASIIRDVVLNPVYTFLNKYIFKLGFLDGVRGLVIATLSAYSNFLKYTKLYFRWKSAKNANHPS